MRRSSGPAIVVVGVVHVLLFAYLHRDRWAAIARDGTVDTVDGNDTRETAFWTMGFGLLLLIVGSLLPGSQSRPGTVPAATGWLFLLLGLGGGVLMPLSPFWLFVPFGVAIVRSSGMGADRSLLPVNAPSPLAVDASSPAGHRGVPS